MTDVGRGIRLGASRTNRLLAAAVALLGLVDLPLAADTKLPNFDRVRVLETPKSIADAVLTDHSGAPFKLHDLQGKVAFVLFGFTNCPDVCPTSMERLRELHDSGSLADDRTAYVLISVDGERDTPAAMNAFLGKYSSRFIGLTAQPAAVTPIAHQFSAAFYKGNPQGHGGGYNVAHSSQIFVLDPQGRLRAEVYGASLEAMAGLASALWTEGSAAK